jgi:predicted N-acetyltransferase YhbS
VSPLRIERLGRDAPDSDIAALADLLLDAVERNAGISFMAGLTHGEAAAWWRTLLATSSDRSIVLVARDDEEAVVGTVQLQAAWAPNQPHRADVAKLIVRRSAEGRGIARLLMQALEHAAAETGFTLLVLDTCKGSRAEALYASLGWTRVGEIPRFALNPDGTYCDTVYFYKAI